MNRVVVKVPSRSGLSYPMFNYPPAEADAQAEEVWAKAKARAKDHVLARAQARARAAAQARTSGECSSSDSGIHLSNVPSGSGLSYPMYPPAEADAQAEEVWARAKAMAKVHVLARAQARARAAAQARTSGECSRYCSSDPGIHFSNDPWHSGVSYPFKLDPSEARFQAEARVQNAQVQAQAEARAKANAQVHAKAQAQAEPRAKAKANAQVHAIAQARTSAECSRLYVCCPEVGDVWGVVMLHPVTFDGLLNICTEKYGFSPCKITNLEGHEYEFGNIDVIRDEDYVVFCRYKSIDETCDKGIFP